MPLGLVSQDARLSENSHSRCKDRHFSRNFQIILYLFVFFCEVDGDDKIKMDESELKYAEWVSREEVELQPNDYSLTNEMMKMFKSGADV